MKKLSENGTERYVFIYDDSGAPYAIEYYNSYSGSMSKYYYVLNLQGDVIQLTDSENGVVANYTYDAWGKLLSVTDVNGNAITDSRHIANVNPIRYRGYFYDTETRLYYCNSRYYDPQMRRFINADGYATTGQGFGGYNMFAYCQNNPVGYIDSNGNRCVSVVNADFLGKKKDVTVDVSKNELQLFEFAAVIYAEAGATSDITIKAVAHSIMNRVGDYSLSSNVASISDIVNDPGQYNASHNTRYNNALQFYKTGTINDSQIEISEMNKVINLVIPIYNGLENDFTGGVHSFHNLSTPEAWTYHYYYEQVYILGAYDGIFWYRHRK